MQAILMKSQNPKKKYTVYVENINNGKRKKINFGSAGMNDYTLTNDDKAKERYINRHQSRENWNNPFSAGFWSKHLLWNDKTIEKSISKITRDYNMQIENMI